MGNVTVYLSDELHKKVTESAVKNNLTVSKQIVKILEERYER